MAERLAPGTIIGDAYRVVRLLGSGGMGEVYVAEQLSTGRERALKLMHARLQDDDKLRERFVQEARVASRISSAHCVEVIGAGVQQDSGTPWLAMELLEGEDLGAALRSKGALTQQRTLEVLEQICHAVGEAHDAGIVHRDLKPENIFIANAHAANKQTTVKVLDFGIAKLIEQTQSIGTGAIGSPAWMAPEQAEAGELISPAADVWSLGLLTFRMLSGFSFWRAAQHDKASMHAFLKEVLFEALPIASKRAAEFDCADRLPDGFDQWFERCVHREVRARFGHARELLAAFRPLIDPNAKSASLVELPADLATMDTAAFLESPAMAPGPDDSVDAEEPEAETGQIPEPPASQAATLASAPPQSQQTKRWLAIGAVAAVALGVLVFTAGGATNESAYVSPPPAEPVVVPPAPSTIVTTAALAPSASAAPPLNCGETTCSIAAGGACCWDNHKSQGPVQGQCVKGSLQADGCATTKLGETKRGYETRIECQKSAHCNRGEVCCGRLVDGGYKGHPYYEDIRCMARCPPPRRQLCDEVSDGGRCPRLPSGGGTIQAECKRSNLLPAGYLVCGYPEVVPK